MGFMPVAAVTAPARSTRSPISCFSCYYLFIFPRATQKDLQEIHAAGAGWWGDPNKTEAGGGLVADVGGHDAANKLGSSKLTI